MFLRFYTKINEDERMMKYLQLFLEAAKTEAEVGSAASAPVPSAA